MNVQARIQVLTSAGLGVLLVLSGRVYDLTVRRHTDLRRDAERRQRRVEVLPARRAPIVDRKGRPLAIDHPVEDVGLLLPDLDPVLQWVVPVGHAFRVSREESLALLRGARGAARGLDPDDEEAEVELGAVGLEDAARAARVLRRAEGVWTRVEPDGLRIYASPELLRTRDETLARLGDLLEQPLAELQDQVEEAVDGIYAVTDRGERIARWNRPHVLIEEAPFEVVARVSERSFELPGVVIRKRFARRYPHGEVAAHLVGSLGLPTPAERERDRELLLDGDQDSLGFLLGERSYVESEFRLRDEPYGRTGLERAFDSQLRGTPGVRVQVRDSRNRIRETLLELPPRDGQELRLTLDNELQAKVEASLDAAVLGKGDPKAGGAAVILDLRDGGILALASSPRFDPNAKRQIDVWKALNEDPRKPLLNRALLSYTPASTWKILSAFAITDPSNPAALSPHWRTTCTGRLFANSRTFKCDGVHPDTGLVKAIERSCNVFFFRGADVLGRVSGSRKLNPAQSLLALNAWTDRVGLGRPVARGLSGERGGVIPTPDYKARRAEELRLSVLSWGARLAQAEAGSPDYTRAMGRLIHASFWYRNNLQDMHLRPGDVRNILIGQGDLEATPLQIALIAGLVATGGDFPTPRISQDDPVERRQVPLDRTVLGLVRQGMKRVVTHGTARKANLPRGTAGKTGTGQRGENQPYLAWFMGYYPANDPQIAFAVLVDRTPGHGGAVCGPVARDMINAWRELSR